MNNLRRRSLFKSLKDLVINPDFGLRFTNNGSGGILNNQYIIDNSKDDYDFSQSWTFETRHLLSSFDGSYPYLFGVKFTDGSLFLIRYQSSASIRASWIHNLPSSFQPINMPVNINQWNHILISFDINNRVAVFINGTKYEVTSNAIIAGTLNIDYIGYFGYDDANIKNATGYSSGIRFFKNYPASDLEASELYNMDRKLLQNIPLNMVDFLLREFPFQQELGRQVIETSNSKDGSLSDVDGWLDSDVANGGGVWVDISGIN